MKVKHSLTEVLDEPSDNELFEKLFCAKDLCFKISKELLDDSDAFTHGPTGPGPRGPQKFSNFGGPQQNFGNL